MKYNVYRPQLYEFLRNIIDNSIEKKILDCGAGGKRPPLGLFKEYGFLTYGIDISRDQIERAKKFEKVNNMDLNINYGDMRKIDFPDESFSYVYSIGSIYHLTKSDTELAINEMIRVLRPGGSLFVDFLSIEDSEFGNGTPVDSEKSTGEFFQEENGNKVIHSYYEDDEPDSLFDGLEIRIVHKNKMRLKYKGKEYRPAYINYIVDKPKK